MGVFVYMQFDQKWSQKLLTLYFIFLLSSHRGSLGDFEWENDMPLKIIVWHIWGQSDQKFCCAANCRVPESLLNQLVHPWPLESVSLRQTGAWTLTECSVYAMLRLDGQSESMHIIASSIPPATRHSCTTCLSSALRNGTRHISGNAGLTSSIESIVFSCL